jgi:hypothetical protein
MTEIAPKKKTRRKEVKPIPEQAFENVQLSLFQHFLANEEEQDDFSNAIDFWDNVPRYSISKQKMDELRLPGGLLPIRKIDFHYRGQPYSVSIRPAQLEVKDQDGKLTGDSIFYYPSAREELIEHALRKLAADQQAGFFDKVDYRSGLRFTLYQLRRELEEQGHSLRYDQLIEGLKILNRSGIEIAGHGRDDSECFGSSPYLPALVGVNRREIDNDRKARWFIEFHPFVTDSINRLTYRQFNYERLMRCSTQLARWLLQQLVLKYTAASLTNTFEMRYSTIKRDSALLSSYRRERAAISAVDDAWEELKELGTLYGVKKIEQHGFRNKLEDVTYTLAPSLKFQTEQKAANRRNSDAQTAALSVDKRLLLPSDRGK